MTEEKDSTDRRPIISVIIPAFQHARELPVCLDSVFAQTRQNFEVIVVNDGSTDGTEEVIKPYLSRIDYVSQDNQGGNAARNRGFERSRGDLVLFCDADIVMRPDCLERMEQALGEHPEASYTYCSFYYGWKRFRLWPFNAERLRQLNYIHTTSLVRREHFPGFDESIRRLQDWDLWLTMLADGHTGVWTPEYLFTAIPHRGGISTWLPGIAYRLPWRKFGLRIGPVEKFQAAERIIREKHGLK